MSNKTNVFKAFYWIYCNLFFKYTEAKTIIMRYEELRQEPVHWIFLVFQVTYKKDLYAAEGILKGILLNNDLQ